MSKPPVSSVVSGTKTNEGSSSDGSVPRGSVTDRINSVRPIVLWIAPLLLATLSPGLAWASLERPMATQVALVAAMSVGVGLVAVALVAALSWGFTTRVRWALGVATAATLVLFGWPAFTDAGVQVAAAFRLSVLSDAVPVLLAVTSLWLAVRLAGETRSALPERLCSQSCSALAFLPWSLLRSSACRLQPNLPQTTLACQPWQIRRTWSC